MVPIISEEKLLELLPHGSGINCEWNILIYNNGNIKAKNFFHAMNESGYYDGYMPFFVHIFRHKQDVFHTLHGQNEGRKQVINRINDIDFTLVCNDKCRSSFYGLREYLNDTVYYSLETLLTKRSFETI